MKTIRLILTSLFAFLFTSISFGQILYPGGETCETAVPIPVADGYTTPFDGPGSDHWYSFIAPCDGELVVSNGAPNECDKRIHVGECGDLTEMAYGSWATTEISLSMLAGESAYIQLNDSWDGSAEFNIEFDICPDIDSALLDISGMVYYDMNDNGIKDIDEVGKFLNPILSDPEGVFSVTGPTGFYYSSVAGLDDGVYEIYPDLDDYWRISSDSLVYTLNIDVDYEQRDSLDFGIYPDTIFYEIDADLIGGYPRCNDTINYYINIRNIGTTIASGFVHLELDDSLYYVSADILPDSIVGQNLYWTYNELFFDEHELITVNIGTPDGEEDTVSSSLLVTVDSADVEMFSSTQVLEQVITCAYDPNDKTPEPFGIGEFGYISPETESIEYLIRFQNTGTDTAINVVIKDQLDENLDWYSMSILSYSHDIQVEMDIDGEVSFIFNDIMLPDSNVNNLASQGFVKYKIDLIPGLPLETSIFNTANIYFDLNPAVITNTTINTLHIDDSSIDELMDKQQLLVYPNPFSESTTVYFGKDLNNHSIQIVDLLGSQVYVNNNVNGSQLEIEAGELKQGMYILLLFDNASNDIVSNVKLMVK